jgi:hypothetical protein
VLWAVLSPPAVAAQVRLDDACRAPGEATRVLGTGFAAGSSFSTMLDDRPLGAGAVDALGSLSAAFPAPIEEGRYVVRVSDLQGSRGRATLRVARATLRLTPTPRDADSARVRFVVHGMGANGSSIWLHRVDPAGRPAGRGRLGTATGACGELTSGRRRLLPRHPRAGRWRLQVDTRMSYDPRATPRVVQNVRVPAR